MGIIAFLILGLLAGMIAKAILPGEDPGGLLITMAIGVVGALIGGFLAPRHVRRPPARRVLRHLDVDPGHRGLGAAAVDLADGRPRVASTAAPSDRLAESPGRSGGPGT